MILDLSLKNRVLYQGCSIETVGGRENLVTPLQEAIPLVGHTLNFLVSATPTSDRESVTLTGAMAVWVYLLAFHAVVHAFKKVYYDDGKNGPILIAAHG